MAAVLLPPAINDGETLSHMLDAGLFLAFLYWQVMPVLLVSTGLSLEIEASVVYPVSRPTFSASKSCSVSPPALKS